MKKQRVTRRRAPSAGHGAKPADGDGTRPGAGAANSAGSSEVQFRPPGSTGPLSGDGSSLLDGTHFDMGGSILPGWGPPPSPDISTSDMYKPGVLGASDGGGQPEDVDGTSLADEFLAWVSGYMDRDAEEERSSVPADLFRRVFTVLVGAALRPVYGPRPPASGPLVIPDPEELLLRLEEVKPAGSCTCMNHLRRPSAHGTRCPFRLITEAAEVIGVLVRR